MKKIKCVVRSMSKNPEYIMVDVPTKEGFIIFKALKVTDQNLFTIGQELDVPVVCFPGLEDL